MPWASTETTDHHEQEQDRMATKTYNAGVKEYRSTYWEPHYTVKDTDILACS